MAPVKLSAPGKMRIFSEEFVPEDVSSKCVEVELVPLPVNLQLETTHRGTSIERFRATVWRSCRSGGNSILRRDASISRLQERKRIAGRSPAGIPKFIAHNAKHNKSAHAS
jgi:hypothetical protein